VNLCKEKLGRRVESLYSVGSYASGKISIERPRLTFLLIFSGHAVPEDYLSTGEICRNVTRTFENKCNIHVEFRPFRYIYSKVDRGYNIFLNPVITSTDDIKASGMIFSKWLTSNLKSFNKLLFGNDFLSTISVGEITKTHVLQGALFELPFFTIPLTYAPAQYDESEPDLLFNEALADAENICYIGVELEMNEDELRTKEFVKYIRNKETMTGFYRERYGEEASRLVEAILEARDNYPKYKNDKKKVKEFFCWALQIGELVQRKLCQSSPLG
jgi:hypothetical protein